MAGGFSVEGEGRVLGQLDAAAENFRVGLMQASHMAGQVLVRTVQGGMQGAGGGRVYGSHQASAPGGYSAIRTGQLYGSADYEVSGANMLRFGVGATHGIYQELGTSKMAARPNLGNAVRDAGSTVENLLGQVTFRRIVGG
ncbi:MAG: hypothetical protein NW216_07570 [Hyphomicrobium sp.]|nr:hypothetical protein [Hyphomicrobium sp.]